MICYSERGEPSLSFEYKFVGHSWKLHKLYPSVHSYFFFSSHCIVLFPLRAPASWRSAKCTRKLFKVWRNWPNSKLICYSERGEPSLSFEYKFVGHSWKLHKLYPSVHSYFFFFHTVLYCFHWEHQQVEGVRSAHGSSLRYEGIGQIQNWYVILKGENLVFHLNINLSAILENFTNYIQVYIHISFFSLHCIVLFPLRAPASWRSAKCTRRLFKVWRNWPNSKLICYSERGQPRLLFEYTFFGYSWKLHKLYPSVHTYFFFSLHCIVVSTVSTSKLKECEVHTEAL